MFEAKEKEGNTPLKGDMFLSNGRILQVQPIIWQRNNEGILRQALLSPEKEMKADEKMVPVVVDICESEDRAGRKRRGTELVEAIHLYSAGPDGSEYTTHLLSQLTSSTLPTISCSQVSSVLSALEPNNSQIVTGVTDNRAGSKDKQKAMPLPPIGTDRITLDKMEWDKKFWYKCRDCEFICIDEGLAVAHGEKCPGPVNKLKCMACDNMFKSSAILKAHLLIDHSIAVHEHSEIIDINLDIINSQSTSKKGKEQAEEEVPPAEVPAPDSERTSGIMIPTFSLFESVTKFIGENSKTGDEGGGESEKERDVKREKRPVTGKQQRKHPKKVNHVKVEKEVGIRCGLDGCTVRLISLTNMEYHRQCHSGVKWKCTECGDVYQSWPNLTIHLWKQHSIDMELYSCDQCSYKTNSLSKLMNLHRRTHGDERPFLCDLCGKGFKTTKQLRNHKAIHKAKEKGEGDQSVSCNICSRSFACLRMLKHHTDIVHRKLRPYLCSDCGHSAASKSSLRMHARQHTGEKPYACNECDYRTSDHNTLRRHKMRHSGAKHYTCPHCPYASIQSSTFKSHLKNKHPGLDDGLMFSCEICPFKTVKKDNFLAHTSYHSLNTRDNELSKEEDVDLHEYNLRNLVKEVSSSILPCGGRSFLSDGVSARLKAEQILSRERDPLLGDSQQADDLMGESEP